MDAALNAPSEASLFRMCRQCRFYMEGNPYMTVQKRVLSALFLE